MTWGRQNNFMIKCEGQGSNMLIQRPVSWPRWLNIKLSCSKLRKGRSNKKKKNIWQRIEKKKTFKDTLREEKHHFSQTHSCQLWDAILKHEGSKESLWTPLPQFYTHWSLLQPGALTGLKAAARLGAVKTCCFPLLPHPHRAGRDGNNKAYTVRSSIPTSIIARIQEAHGMRYRSPASCNSGSFGELARELCSCILHEPGDSLQLLGPHQESP